MSATATPVPALPTVPVSLSISDPVTAMFTQAFALGSAALTLAEKIFDAAPKDAQAAYAADCLKVIHNATAPFIALGGVINKALKVDQ